MQRANFMTDAQRKAMGAHKRTHQKCIELTGVARPGKSSQDKAKRTHGK